MIDDSKRDPDAILAKINKQSKGRLTVFIGAAAGVGKTYAMLEAAHERRSEGIDVAIGWVETHGRKETQALVEGLPAIPPRMLEYRGKQLIEMDLDAILSQRPQLVLVDELAHANVPGSRHPRRYLDIEELLEAGIHVYTTLNIQHLESLNDSIKQITGIHVRETVPDRFMERVDQVQLVDIPVEELIGRLKDGKVYVPDMAEKALTHFFRPGNINALRELALRQAASRVDQQMEEYRKTHGIDLPWPAADRVMACISSSPFGIHVLRRASQMAIHLKAELLVVYIEKPRYKEKGLQAQKTLNLNLQLAEDLGAKVISTYDSNIADGILSVARRYNVSQIVLGKPLRPRWLEIIQGSVVDEIVRGSAGMSVHVIPGDPEYIEKKEQTGPVRPKPRLIPYFGVSILVSLIVLCGQLGGEQLGLTNIGMLFLVPVLIASARWGFWPALYAAVTGVLCFDILFIPPVGRLTVQDTRYLITFLVFMAVALTISTLSDRLRYRVRDATRREARIRTLYDLARETTAVTDLNALIKTVVEHIARTLDAEAVILLPDYAGERINIAAASHPESPMAMESSELAVAEWCFHHEQISGSGTDTLPGAYGLYLPLLANEEKLGVMGIRTRDSHLTHEQNDLLQALNGLAALSIGRLKLARDAEEIRQLEASERLRTALFNSISHDLRTPLSAIIGSVTCLLEEGDIYGSEQRKQLLESIKKGSLRMNRVVGNLLDLARIESGLMRLHRDYYDLQDIIGVVLHQSEEVAQDHSVHVELAADLPLVKVDYVLIEQVLLNLLDNAAKYSPAGSDILLEGRLEAGEIILTVADQGSGIPPGQEEDVFNKFYRLQSPLSVSGSGLGLSICKGIIEAHGGRIWFENRQEGGSIVSIALPMEDTLRVQIDESSGEEAVSDGSTNPGH